MVWLEQGCVLGSLWVLHGA